MKKEYARYSEETVKDVEDFISSKFNVPFSFRDDTYMIGVKLDWLDFYAEKSCSNFMESCVKIGDDFYELYINAKWLMLTPYNKDEIEKVKNRVISISYDNYINNLDRAKKIFYDKEWTDFRKSRHPELVEMYDRLQENRNRINNSFVKTKTKIYYPINETNIEL